MRFARNPWALAAAAACTLGLASPVLAVETAVGAGVPARPEQLTYKAFDFATPDGSSYRHTLPGGVVVYVVEDHSLPLVKLQATFRTGAFREGEHETGLAAMTAAMMRQGGTTRLTPEQFDQKADFLAAIVGSSAGATSAAASLDVITPALGEGLDLLFDMLRNPRFDEARLAVQKSTALEEMKQRNDDAGDIAEGQGEDWPGLGIHRLVVSFVPGWLVRPVWWARVGLVQGWAAAPCR